MNRRTSKYISDAKFASSTEIAQIERKMSFRTSQTNIARLLDSLVAGTEETTISDKYVNDVQSRVTFLMAKFSSNLSGMQKEFRGIIESFKNGTLQPLDIQALLEAEEKRGMFTLQLAEDMKVFLENIFAGINELMSSFSQKISKKATKNLDDIFLTLDLAMESVVCISKIAATSPEKMEVSINTAETEKSKLLQNSGKGHFAKIVNQFRSSKTVLAEEKNDGSVSDESSIGTITAKVKSSQLKFPSESVYKNKAPNLKHARTQKSAIFKMMRDEEETVPERSPVPSHPGTPNKIPFKHKPKSDFTCQATLPSSNKNLCKLRVLSITLWPVTPPAVTESENTIINKNTLPVTLAPAALLKYSEKIKKYGNKKSDDKDKESADPGSGHNLSSLVAASVVVVPSGTTPRVAITTNKVAETGELAPPKKSKASKAIEKMKAKLQHVTDLKEYQQFDSSEPVAAAANNNIKLATNSMFIEGGGGGTKEKGKELSDQLLLLLQAKEEELRTREDILQQRENHMETEIKRQLQYILTTQFKLPEKRVTQQLRSLPSSEYAELKHDSTNPTLSDSLFLTDTTAMSMSPSRRPLSPSAANMSIVDEYRWPHSFHLAHEIPAGSGVAVISNIILSYLGERASTHLRVSIDNTDNNHVLPMRNSGLDQGNENDTNRRGVPFLNHLGNSSMTITSAAAGGAGVMTTQPTQSTQSAMDYRHNSRNSPMSTHFTDEYDLSLEKATSSGFLHTSHPLYLNHPLSASNRDLKAGFQQTALQVLDRFGKSTSSMLPLTTLAVASPTISPEEDRPRAKSPFQTTHTLTATILPPAPRLSRTGSHSDFSKDSELMDLSNYDYTASYDIPSDNKTHSEGGKRFIETIIIYPINTRNKSTSTTTDYDDNNFIKKIAAVGSPDDNVNNSQLSPHSTLSSKLRTSENPLLLLYETYKNDLSELAKSRFLSAVSGESNSTNSLPILSKVFTNVIQEMEMFSSSIATQQSMINKLEDTATALITLAATDESYLTREAVNDSVNIFFSDTGSVSSSLLLLQLQFSEYRTMFERLIASEASRLPRLLQSCAAFNESYQIFVDCQGKLVTLNNKLADLRLSSQRGFRQRNITIPAASRSTTSNTVRQNAEIAKLRERLLSAEALVSELQTELKYSGQEIEHLENDLFDSENARDSTPAAFLFFAALQDDNALPSIQQVVLQLGHFKSFIDGSEHIDFPTLRKRLTVCVDCVPNIKRFIERYSKMYQKWLQDRRQLFSERKLAGGNADHAMICPMCNADSRHSQSASAFPRPRTEVRPSTGHQMSRANSLHQSDGSLFSPSAFSTNSTTANARPKTANVNQKSKLAIAIARSSSITLNEMSKPLPGLPRRGTLRS